MSDDTLRVVARVIAKSDRVDELRDTLMGLIEPTRGELGCLVYELLQNEEDPASFVFVEEWKDGDAFVAHMDSNHFRAAASLLPELVAEDPVIQRFHQIG